MIRRTRLSMVLAAIQAALFLSSSAGAEVVINELFYHPASEDSREEFIELLNNGSTPVDLEGWRFTDGVDFAFPPVILPAGGLVVVAADLAMFTHAHPTVTNVVGNWSGRLSNNHEDLDLDDAQGNRVDSVTFADEGDWGERRRGPLDYNHRGWLWVAAHDGGGKSAELINPDVSNNHGQNWAPSVPDGGTPGVPNSVFQTNRAPLILDVQHVPAVPRSVDSVVITSRLVDESGLNLTATLHWRLDGGPVGFAAVPMFDDGAHEDGAANDSVYGAAIPAQSNNAIIEFYVTAEDGEGLTRSWPAPAVDTDGTPLGLVANALYQVDDSSPGSAFPLYKLVMKEADRAELAAIGSAPWPGESESDAQMNGTFISLDGAGIEVRYTTGIRNRGHGSRNSKPNSYRVNFTSDRPWKGVTALNLNAHYTHPQLLGSVLALKSGLAGASSLPVQVRVNNANLGESTGPHTYGATYVANEVINSDWAEHWFPEDASGNLYRAIRDIDPPNFDYRGTNWSAYTNTYFKTSNTSENDWNDLMGMLEVLGEDRTALFTMQRARSVIDVDQWLLHLAVMSLFGNGESGLNTGNNDDYFMYAGMNDSRFILMYYDLDQILGQGGSLPTTTDIFRSTCCPVSGDSEGSWRAMNFFLHQPEIELAYHRALRQLLETSFSEQEFNATVDQTLAGFVPESVLNAMKSWMNGRRAYVQSVIDPYLAAHPLAPTASVSGEPRSPTPLMDATLVVGGEGITQYRFSLNDAPFGPATPVATPISVSGLVDGTTNRIHVIGGDTNGIWQSESNATVSAAWVVHTNWPSVRINEVLSANQGAFDHSGTFPDAIELYNEGTAAVDLSGMRLSDRITTPDKFTFPEGTSLAAGAHLVVIANDPDGTPGLHSGFSLNQDGEAVFLFHSAASGGALLDSVEYGLQLPDLSIGRLGTAGGFVLTVPTFGSGNLIQPLGDSDGLRINEWLASEFAASATDFVELYNPDSLPVALGGLLMTDNPIGEPRKSPLVPLSYIAGQGYRELKADADPQQGNDHLAFKLAAEHGLIALLQPDLRTIDLIAYGPQQTDIAQGRSPDGDPHVVQMSTPTPGAANASVEACTVTSTQLELLDYGHSWRYNQTQNLDGVDWMAPAYDDSAWPSGNGLLAYESNPLITPLIQTGLTDPRTPPPGLTAGHAYYFRTSFVLTNDLNGYTVTMDARIDDGAILYLNGNELPGRVRMPAGAVFNSTLASANPPSNADAEVGDLINLPTFYLVPGTNVLAVEVHQATTGSSDIVWGMSLTASLAITNCGETGVLLNEILANNQSFTNTAGRTPDWIEIVNTTTNALDLADMSLSDDAGAPRKWVFPSPTPLAAGGRLVVESDGDQPAGTNNTGFSLGAGGDAVYLYAALSEGGGMVDSVRFGLQPTDFSVGRIPDSSGGWTLTLPTPSGANVAAGLGNASQVRLNEWMANPDQGDDWFELYNPAAQPVAVGGLTLSDDPSNRDKSPIPPLSFLGPSGYQMVVADSSPNQGADHVAFQLDADGDFLGLYWPVGTQVDALSFAEQTPNTSEGRFPDGAPALAPFSQTRSPGAPNYLLLTNLVVNEVLSHTDPPLEDAVEIRNLGGSPVDIGGWYLSNSGEALRKYLIPSNTLIEAGGYHVFYEDEFASPGAPGVEFPFRFNSAHGDEVHLSQTDTDGNLTGYRAAAKFGASANGVSFGRFLTSVGEEFVAMEARTFGQDAPVDLVQFRTGEGASNASPRVGPVIFSEIHYLPGAVYGSNTQAGEFIELRNVGDETVPLYDPSASSNTWSLVGGVAFEFPTNTAIPAGGSLLVVGFDPVTDAAQSNWFQILHPLAGGVQLVGPWSGALANEGEPLELYRPDPPQLPPSPDAGFVPQILVERVDYSAASPWPTNGIGAGASLQRLVPTGFGNEPAHWFTAMPSAGADNLLDSDGDGMPDYWELENGLNPTNSIGVNGSAGNLDGDPLSNGEEWQAGTGANDAGDYLRIASIRVVSGGVAIQFRAAGGRTYSVLYGPSPNGPWQKLTDAPMSGNPVDVEVVDAVSTGEGPRFYRVVTPAVPLQTLEVSGTLTGDTIWTAFMPVHVTNDVLVPSNVTLTVESGTLVKVGAGVSILAQAGGAIHVRGTDTHPVQVRSLDGDSIWARLGAEGPESILTVHHADVEHGQVAVLDGASALLDSSRFHDYHVTGGGTLHTQPIVVADHAASIEARACHFSNYYETLFRNGVITLEDCLFEAVTGDAVDFDTAWPGSTIRRCTLRHGAYSNVDAVDLGSDTQGTLVEQCWIEDFPFDKGVSIGEHSSNIVVRGCLIFDVETGIAVKDSSDALVINNTIAQSGHGVRCYQKTAGQGGASAEGWNNVLWGIPVPVELLDGSTFTVNYSDVEGGYAGVSNLNTDPLFLNLLSSDFRLAAGSPCLGSGTNGGPMGAVFPVGSSLLDTDGDGLPDTWEMSYGLDFHDPADAALDLDGDGLSNEDEYLTGTKPDDAGSVLKFVSVRPTTSGAEVSFQAAEGQSYRILYRDDPSDGSWFALTNLPARPDAVTMTVTDSVPSATGNRLYRVMTTPLTP